MIRQRQTLQGSSAITGMAGQLWSLTCAVEGTSLCCAAKHRKPLGPNFILKSESYNNPNRNSSVPLGHFHGRWFLVVGPKYTNIRKNAEKYENIPTHTKTYTKIHRHTKTYKNIQENTRGKRNNTIDIRIQTLVESICYHVLSGDLLCCIYPKL